MSSRITKYQRDIVVRRIMDDVPQVDYEEQAQNLLANVALRSAPPGVQDLWKREATRFWIETKTVYTIDHYTHFNLPWHGNFQELHKLMTKDEQAKFDSLMKSNEEQDNERNLLQKQVKGALDSVTTWKAFAERYPEFDKYVDPEFKANAQPVVAQNLITDLMKAGWPDGGKKKE